jgi:hypothetical protein
MMGILVAFHKGAHGTLMLASLMIAPHFAISPTSRIGRDG